MKFSRGDTVFSLAIFGGIALLSALLYLHSRERSSGSGKVIGKVFYKHEVAMRKLSDRMVWDDVESGSPLYSNDAVMTGSLSDAELVLDSGLKLKLEANTLIELDLAQEGLTLKLAGGGIKTAGAQNTQTLVQTKSGQAINVTNGAASIRSEGKQVAVEVKEGKVEVTTKDGKKETVVKGEILAAGKKARIALAISEPAEDAVYLTGGDSARVAFTCSPTNAVTVAEIAKNGNFAHATRIALTQGRATTAVKNGDWFLRCAGAENAVSTVRRFRVVSAGAYKVFRPEKPEIAFTDKAVLRLEFQSPRSVTITRIEVADNPQFTNSIFTESGARTSLQINLPQAGKYFYRLTPSAEGGRIESQLASTTGSVKLVQVRRTPLAFVTVTAPIFSLTQVEANQAVLGFEGDGKYRAEIFRRGEAKPSYNGTAQGGSFVIPITFGGGKYELRLSGANEKATQAFEVRDKLKVAWASPTTNTILYLSPGEKAAELPVAWTGSEEIALYQLVLAEDAGFKNIVNKISVEGQNFRFVDLTPRKYFLKVLALENNIARAESLPISVSVEEKLSTVSQLYPSDAQTVDVSKSSALHLKWRQSVGANAYEVKIFQKRHGKLVLVDTQTTQSAALQISNFKKINEGDIIWEVRALQKDKAGRVALASEPVRSKLQLSFGPQLAAPEIVPVIE